ncbi:hypothetical protein evm_012125 [Chilo suppressalis]|nr:hypothetical protein evm_012125 [Chilo suppressalis]
MEYTHKVHLPPCQACVKKFILLLLSALSQSPTPWSPRTLLNDRSSTLLKVSPHTGHTPQPQTPPREARSGY